MRRGLGSTLANVTYGSLHGVGANAYSGLFGLRAGPMNMVSKSPKMLLPHCAS